MARKTSASRKTHSNPGGGDAQRESEPSRSSPNGRGGAHRGQSAGEPRRPASHTQSRRGGNRGQLQRSRQDQPQRRGRASSGNVFFDTGSAVVDAVREHPIPAVLIGAGLAWMLLETRAARDVESRLLEQARTAAGKVGEAFSGLAETAREAYGEASESTYDRLSGAADSMKENVAGVGTALQSGARAVSETAYAGYERSRDALSEAWEQHPLAVGASLLVAGVATGLMMPASVREGRLIGAAAANVTEKVRTRGSELLEQGKELVSSSTSALTREARRFGIGVSSGGGRRRSGKKR
jgi:hypothetical protein